MRRGAHHSFAERVVRQVTSIATPIRRQIAALHISMKTAVWPVAHARHEAMFDRIEMDVVDVPFQIAGIANDVFPIVSLPDALFPLSLLARRE